MSITNNIRSKPDELARPEWLGTAQWPFALRRHQHLTPDGEPIDIHYTDEGTGPTLVLVHAGLWSFLWRDAIAGLRSRFRCITVDFPGAGLSGGGPSQVDIRTFPAVLDGILDRCEVERATFVIHDLGGVVGVTTAAMRPARVAGLVATNSFAWAPDRLALRSMLGLMGSSGATATLGRFRVIPRLSGTGMGVGRHLDADDRRAFLGPYRNRTAAGNFHRAMGSAVRARPELERAEAALKGPLSHLPVLTVFGARNDPFRFGRRWKSLFPGATQWEVDGGNHFPMCDDPAGYVDTVTAWHEREGIERINVAIER